LEPRDIAACRPSTTASRRQHSTNRYPTTNHRIGSSSKMSATQESQKKTFGKSTREVPHHSQKASKWYPAEDESAPRKVRSSNNKHDSITICDKYSAKLRRQRTDQKGCDGWIVQLGYRGCNIGGLGQFEAQPPSHTLRFRRNISIRRVEGIPNLVLT
jgi:hypothetical protein